MVRENTYWVKLLEESETFFGRATACLTEEDSSFAPAEGMFTVAGQVGHTALTVHWFLDGGFKDTWDLDFEQHVAEANAFTSLGAAREHLAAAFERARDCAANTPAEVLRQPLPQGEIMPGAPRGEVFGAIAEHTAHHRGALSVYARLRGKVPAMPYA